MAEGNTIIPQEFLEAIATEHGVSNTEFRVLSYAIEGESTAAIAQKLGTRAEVIRNRLREVYKKFNIVGAGPGKLAKLQQRLVSEYQVNFPTDRVAPTFENITPQRDWGEAPDASVFYGRAEELATLQQWIVRDGCRLVAILGLGGMGKTTLSVKFAKQIQDQFEFVIWRSLRQPPSVNELLADLLQILSPPPTTAGGTRVLSENLDALVSQLIEALRTSQSLLILDNVETILESGELAGHYREGYKGYGELFRRIGEVPLNSCVVLTSLEKPKEIAQLEGKTLPVRSLTLKGLQEIDAREILKAKGLSGEDKWNILIKLYRGNPLALKLVATTIEELFNGQVSEFLKRNMLVFGDLHDLLDQPFNRLSDLEKEIMYWLGIEHQPSTVHTLQQDLWLPVSQRDMFEALSSLGRRSLIEISTEGGASLFTLQPDVMEYVINQFIEQVSDEIYQLFKTQTLEQTQLFRSHALVKVLVSDRNKDFVGNASTQTQPLLTAVVDRLRTIFKSETKITQPLSEILQALPQKSPLEVGYASNNILHLLEELNAAQVQAPYEMKAHNKG